MAAGSTYTPITTQTLGSSTSSVTISSIPSTYTDLILIVNGTSSNENAFDLRFNGDTGANYSTTAVYGTGSGSGASYRASGDTKMDVGRSDSSSGVSIINIQNYANATTYKTVLSRGNDSSLVIATVNLWRSTSAITSLTIGRYTSGTSMNSGTTFTLYGIAAA